MTSQQIVSGWLLILSSIIFVPAGILYSGRAILKWPAAQSPGFLHWERGFVMAAILVATLGLTLLDKLLEAAGDRILAPSGMVIFLIATALVIAAEAFSLSQQKWVYAQTVVFVVLAFLGQAAFGASILITAFLPGWVGWATIIWNLGMLVYLPVFKPRDIYYPWVHYIAPLVIGINLLGGR